MIRRMEIESMSGIVTVIPARGGSKGIPGKNIIDLCGRPLICYSIQHSLQTDGIDATYVSTDCAAIADAARSAGAEVIDRPAAISSDTASSESALIHALDHHRSRAGSEPDTVVFLQATSPFRKPDDIRKALDMFAREKADSLFSSSPLQGFVWRISHNETVSLNYDHRNRTRRQDSSVDVMENGSIYVFKPWVLRRFRNRLGGRIAVYPMGMIESIQIDEPSDLDLARRVMTVVLRDGWF